VSLWRAIWRRRALRRIRQAMRGSRRLREHGNVSRIARLREELTELPLDELPDGASRLLFGSGHHAAETVVRQIVLLRCANHAFVEAVLRSIGTGRPVRTALPASWRPVLARHGFQVSRLCGPLFAARATLILAAGLRQVVRLLASESGRKIQSKDVTAVRAAYFDSLISGNLPCTEQGKRGHDVITWYLNGPGKAELLEEVWHDVSGAPPLSVGHVRVRSNPAPPCPSGAYATLSFVGWFFAAFALAAVDLLRGRWWHAFVLRDAVLAAAMRLAPEERVARSYLFHNSAWFYRPLWTYEAERRGASVSLYFYSTNTQGVSQNGEACPIGYGWRAMTWPRYFVWDRGQEKFVRRAVGEKPELRVVGVISWLNENARLPPTPRPSLAVFDVAPLRPSTFQTLGLESDYYSGQAAIGFLQDVLSAAEACSVHVLWKRKREFGPTVHGRYLRVVAQAERSSALVAIDSGVAAARLIETVDAVVSFPFTSTAIIARELGKPSCYYDSTGTVHPADPSAHGIPVISGRRNLEKWIEFVAGGPAASHVS
jgi:polysaccharide biosynthesis PFTS motif protein